ncbi:MAG: hypothetical protein J1E29_04385 [Duncaniella sp.]|nr:hypothetical protein [Duncaniella sp.]
MKRIFTLLSLLLCVAAVAVAASYLPQGLNEISEYKVVYCTDITSAGNPATDWVVVPNYALNNQSYTNLNGDTRGNPKGIEDKIPNATSVAMIKLKNTVTTFEQNEQTIHMHVKGITGVIGHGTTSSTNRGMAISCTEYAPGLVNLDNTTHHAEVIRSNSSGSFIAQVTGLDAATEYVVTFYGLSGEVRFYCAEFLVPDAPVEAIDPVFSLTNPSITLEETSQIQVGNKGGLDGIAISGLEYDDKVVTVSSDGLVTPVGVGSTTIKFTSAPVEDKYNASSAELPIQVTAPVVATPVISPADGSYFIETATVTATCATEGALLY